MEFVLVRIFVVFQVDLDLVRHPFFDVLAPQARQYANAPKRQRGQSSCSG